MHHLRRIIVVSVVAWFGSAAPARAAGWGVPPAPEAAPGSTPAPSAMRPSEMPSAVVPASVPASTAVAGPPAASPSQAEGVTAPDLLRTADAAIAGGDLPSARLLFERLLREAPSAPEAVEARRALRLIGLGERRRWAAAPVDRASSVAEAPNIARGPSNSEAVVIRQEPYSLKTSERLRLTAWEKLDFGVTAFVYGMSLGTTFALGLPSPTTADVTMPIVLGASAYALGAVAYLQVANPDRGDLPLMLGITSYIPTTTQLIGHFAFDHPNQKKIGIATVASGLISIPLGIALTQKLDLDPGDTQLVRDAGFWGLVLCASGAWGFGGNTISGPGYSYATGPSERTVSGMGLLGLFGGLGLGVVAAANTEISLERIRVTTWGGYGGAVLGALIGASMSEHDEDEGIAQGLTVGALAGLAITFATTGGLDGIPPSETPGKHAASRSLQWTPTVAPMAGANGQPVPALGLAGVL